MSCACPYLILNELVGERGFEPPTPWSRTRCSTRLSHSPTDYFMTASTGTTWRLEPTQYSILRPRNLSAGPAPWGCYNLGHHRFVAIKTFLCWLLLREGF